MSYTYLRFSRCPYQREPPPAEEGSIDALLDPSSTSAHTIFRTQILTNTHPSPLTVAEQSLVSDEPLPFIDYHLLNLLIHLATPQLDKHDKKRYDYFIEARRWYYQGHTNFQQAFRELQDANGHRLILESEFQGLARHYHALKAETQTKTEAEAKENAQTLAILTSQLAHLEISRRANNEDLRHLLKSVHDTARARDDATSWLSSMKSKFLQTEMPPLVKYANDLYRHLKGGSNAAPPQIDLPPLKSHASKDLGKSERDKDGDGGNGAAAGASVA